MALFPLITIALSSHRLEMLPVADREMSKHEAVVLEEAPEPDFPAMLAGEVSIDAYLEDKDTEFPEYSREQLQLLRHHYRAGKAILQVEPYLARLLQIHELLLGGLHRAEVEARPGLQAVYEAESLAFRALLTFYTCAHTTPFLRVVAAVQNFAQADAARFRLRDTLRADSLLSLTARFRSLYVEAGFIHLYLVKALRRLLGGRARLRPVFLWASRSLAALSRPRPLGPGDLLTLHYIFQTPPSAHQEKLLAARSLIHIQLLDKNEFLSSSSPTPHLDNEILACRLTAQLSLEDCAALYPQIRKAGPEVAREIVMKYLKDSGGRRQEFEVSG